MEARPSPRGKRRIVGCALLAGASFLLVASAWGPARATSVIQLTDEHLVGLSSSIFEGRVRSVRSEWNADRTQIHTLVTIDVTRVLTGPAPKGGVQTLRLLGGQVGDTVMELVGGPIFRTGEDVVVFLERGAPELMPITGLFQGTLTIVTDAASGRRVVKERGEDLQAFRDRVARIAAAQKGGRR